MCGRYVISSSAEIIAQLFAASQTQDLRPRYNVAPTQSVPVVQWTQEGRLLTSMRGGLTPSWAKSKVGPRGGIRLPDFINARSETAAIKPSFRSAWKRGRCILTADGFYEWKRNQTAAAKEKGNKQPYYIYRKDQKNEDSKTLEDSPRARLLFMAGIYSVGEGAGGKQIYSYSVLTREADSCLSWLHHR